MPQPYADRLAREGAVLAAAGFAGSAALLATQPEARRWPWNTVVQLAIVAAALLGPGTAATRRAVAGAPTVAPWRAGDGEPTPLWHVPVPVVAGALAVGPVAKALPPLPSAPLRRLHRKAGWDAALRVTGGGALVGLWQALVLRRVVRETQGRRTAVRLPGSRLGATRVGLVRGLPVRR